MAPTARLVMVCAALLPVAALGAIVSPGLWIAIAAAWLALAGAAAIDLFLLGSARLDASAAVPTSLGVGESAPVRLELRVQARRPLYAAIRAEVGAPIERGPDVFAILPAGASAIELTLSAARRGAGRLAAAWIRLEGPFGLFARVVRQAVGAEVVVVPSAKRVRRLALEHYGASGARGGKHQVSRFGAGSELDSLAPYVAGMDQRSVDWKATARHGQLVVRRYRPEKNQRVILCCDTGRLMGDPIDGLSRLDHAVHACQLLAYAALSAGDQVGLHAYAADPVCWLPPAAGLRQLDRFGQALAGLPAVDVETNHFLGLRDLLSRLARRSLVVVMSEFVDATGAEIMIENLAQLALRHLILFVAFDDPVVEAPLAREPASLADGAAAVVAGSLRADRRRVLHKLGRAHVNVVHGPPDRATLELLSRYVRIKRRGLIG